MVGAHGCVCLIDWIDMAGASGNIGWRQQRPKLATVACHAALRCFQVAAGTSTCTYSYGLHGAWLLLLQPPSCSMHHAQAAPELVRLPGRRKRGGALSMHPTFLYQSYEASRTHVTDLHVRVGEPLLHTRTRMLSCWHDPVASFPLFLRHSHFISRPPRLASAVPAGP